MTPCSQTKNNPIGEQIASCAEPHELPDHTPCMSISFELVLKLSGEHEIPGKDVEIMCLKKQVIPLRYIRNFRQFSIHDQIRLLSARVCVVGAGGLGGYLLETLARIGVGELDVIDGDCFETSNLNRQLLSSADNLGQLKADAAAQRVNRINPSAVVHSHPVFFSRENGKDLLENADAAADCLDNIPGRLLLEKMAGKAGIPLISAAVAGTAGHISTIFPKDKGLTALYGRNGDEAGQPADKSLGCLPYTVMLMASLQCSEIVKIILGKSPAAGNQLVVADLSDNSFEKIRL